MSDLAIEELPSPNCDDRPAGQKVDILLLHYTGMPDAGQALRRLRRVLPALPPGRPAAEPGSGDEGHPGRPG
jgi:N-acetylmuramoyl-L-alanine amidase